MLDLLLIPLSGLLDRVRGGLWKDKLPNVSFIKSALYGFVLSLFFTEPSLISIAFAVLFVAGESFGWGTILANALGENRTDWESIQEKIKPLQKSVWGSVAARGVLWGIFPAALGLLDPKFFLALPAIALGFTLAPLLIRVKNKWKQSSLEWGNMEILRGILIASLMWGLMHV